MLKKKGAGKELPINQVLNIITHASGGLKVPQHA